MAPRRSHRKSRGGCLLCKERRVKCDELGPPCGNCKARNTECQYAGPAKATQLPPMSTRSATIDFSPDAGAPKPSPGADRQYLELQLMHRWSTTTYKSFVTPILKDDDVWQMLLVDVALKNDFLLNGIFAMSAFDIASSSEPDRVRYINTALEYQDLAFGSYQAQLCNLTPESHEAVLYFSILLIILALASSQFEAARHEPVGKVQDTLVYCGLLRGIGVALLNDPDLFATHPMLVKVKPLSELPRVPLASDTETTLGSIKELNERRTVSALDDSSERRLRTMLYAGACKKAHLWLTECFAVSVQVEYETWCMGWIAMAGKDYITAVQEKDPVALLILMCWGVLVEPLERDHWWARNFGKALVDEISDALLGDADPISRSVISWAQGKVEMSRKVDVVH